MGVGQRTAQVTRIKAGWIGSGNEYGMRPARGGTSMGDQVPHPDPAGPRYPPWVPPEVASIGAASFFSDAGHEIATAVLPIFLTGVLRGSAATLGLIEGLSDALLGLAKLVSGPLANQPARRLQLARGGYLLTAVFTAAIGLATAVWQAGVLRAAAWVARGARTPARDAMLAGLAPPDAYGRAFGGSAPATTWARWLARCWPRCWWPPSAFGPRSSSP